MIAAGKKAGTSFTVDIDEGQDLVTAKRLVLDLKPPRIAVVDMFIWLRHIWPAFLARWILSGRNSLPSAKCSLSAVRTYEHIDPEHQTDRVRNSNGPDFCTDLPAASNISQPERSLLMDPQPTKRRSQTTYGTSDDTETRWGTARSELANYYGHYDRALDWAAAPLSP